MGRLGSQTLQASRQGLKVARSAPAFGFGAGSRDQFSKLFVSQEHTLSNTYGRQSPGPATYVLPASVGGKQPDGRKPDPPVWRFAKNDRFNYGKSDPVPDPTRYNLPKSIGGKQPNSAKAVRAPTVRETALTFMPCSHRTAHVPLHGLCAAHTHCSARSLHRPPCPPCHQGRSARQ